MFLLFVTLELENYSYFKHRKAAGLLAIRPCMHQVLCYPTKQPKVDKVQLTKFYYSIAKTQIILAIGVCSTSILPALHTSQKLVVS